MKNIAINFIIPVKYINKIYDNCAATRKYLTFPKPYLKHIQRISNMTSQYLRVRHFSRQAIYSKIFNNLLLKYILV